MELYLYQILYYDQLLDLTYINPYTFSLIFYFIDLPSLNAFLVDILCIYSCLIWNDISIWLYYMAFYLLYFQIIIKHSPCNLYNSWPIINIFIRCIPCLR